MKRIKIFLILLICIVSLYHNAWAITPFEYMLTDVLPSQFSVVWYSGGASSCDVVVFSDESATMDITSQFNIESESANILQAEANGVMKVKVSDAQPDTVYYVQAITNFHNSDERVVSDPIMVKTEISADFVRNNTVLQRIYLSDGTTPAEGVLLLIKNIVNQSKPLSAWMGHYTPKPFASINLGNIFSSSTHTSLDIISGTEATLLAFGGLAGMTQTTIVIDETKDPQIIETSAILASGPPDDQPPIVDNPIPEHIADKNDPEIVIDLTHVFTDPDDEDDLIIKTIYQNTNADLVQTSLTGNSLRLILRNLAYGEADITIMALSNNKTVTDTFALTVNNIDLPPVVNQGIPDILTYENDSDRLISLNKVFTDVDNDDAAITITLTDNTRPELVYCTINGDTLRMQFMENQTGKTSITLTGMSAGQTVDYTFQVSVQPLPQNRFYIASGLTATPSETVSIALHLTNTDREAINALNVDIAYDPNVLTPSQTVVSQTNSLLLPDNYAIAAGVQTKGIVKLVAYCHGESPVDMSGVLFHVLFDVIGASGMISALDYSQTVLNSKIIPGIPGDIHVINASLAGHIEYYTTTLNQEKPIKNVMIEISGENVYTALTNIQGNYSQTSIVAGDYYLLTDKTDDLGGLDPTDASIIARASIDEVQLNCLQTIAADVDMDGHIWGMDAFYVAQYGVKRIDKLNAGDCNWLILPENGYHCNTGESVPYVYTDPTHVHIQSHVKKDLIAIRLGDVNGNWPLNLMEVKKRKRSIHERPILLQTNRNKNIDIPVSVFQVYDHLEGVYLHIRYQPEDITFNKITFADERLKTSNYQLIDNAKDGNIYVYVFAFSDVVSVLGEILSLSFTPVSENDSMIVIETFGCNNQVAKGGFDIQGIHSKTILIQTKKLLDM
jgi:hypothetical protein